MKGISLGHGLACAGTVLPAVAVAGLVTSGCLSEAWPDDDDRSLQGCSEERPLPAIAPAADIVVAATDATVSLHRITIHGAGSKYVGGIALQDGQGSIDIGCETMRLAVYSKFDDTQSAFFYALALAEDRLYTITLSCTYEGVLQRVYYSGTDGTRPKDEAADGTCFEPAETATTRLRLPSMAAPYPPPVVGYAIDGATISLSPTGRGSIVIDSVERELLPFGATVCEDECPDNEHHILRSLFWDPGAGVLSYGSVRLYLGTANSVWVDVEVTLPGWTAGVSEWRSATFSTP